MLSASPPRRLTLADDFVVVPDKEQPIVVRLESAPYLFALPESADPNEAAGSLRAEVGEATRSQVLRLREGDRVELWAQSISPLERLDHIQLGSSVRRYRDPQQPDSPYRQSTVREGQLARCTSTAPVFIRVRPKVH